MKKNGRLKAVTVILLIIVAVPTIYIITNADSLLLFFKHKPTPTETIYPVKTPEPTLPPTSTPSHIAVVPPASTPTPYAFIYNGFLNCRRAPSTDTEVLITLRGELITIIGQNQTRDWLHVMVQGFNKHCWIFKDIPYLDLDKNSLTRFPTIVVTVNLTFTNPPS